MTSMEELLKEKESSPKIFHRGTVVEGVVLKKSKDMLLLDIGAKSEGVVSGGELEDGLGTFAKVSPGDSVLATVIQNRSERGLIALSLKGALREREWRSLKEAYKNNGTLRVKVVGFNRGGLIVDAGVEGFLPLSHLDPSHFPRREEHRARGESSGIEALLSGLVGEELLVKIIEFEPQNDRLVVSEKKALSRSFEEKKKKLWKKLSPGLKVVGVVTGIVPFGLFVSLEDTNVEGLVHLSEISWGKVSHPSDLYEIGDRVKAQILSLDPDKEKISLSLRNLTPNPWEKVGTDYTVGEMVEGVVTKVTPFGAFVRLKEGIEGLIHVSETVGPLVVGEKVRVRVVELKPEEQRLGLSVRDIENSKLKSKMSKPQLKAKKF